MRTIYHEKLAELSDQMGTMSDLAGAAMRLATEALLNADLAVAEQVIGDQESISAMAAQAQDDAVSLLALQQPVAGELRGIVSTLRIAADIERMGALAVHVAKIVRRRHPDQVLPAEVSGLFTEMGRVASDMGDCAHEVLHTRDAEKAANLREDDDQMDELLRQLFTVLMDQDRWSHGVTAAVDVALLGRFYERFADHAVEIGRRVVFESTGTLPAEQEVGDF